jgi:hypothetical protein
MAMPVEDATAVNTLVSWAMGRRPGGLRITAAQADRAAKQLVAKAHKTLSAGLLPDEADLSRAVVYDLSDPDVRHALTEALERYADRQQTMAAIGESPEKRLTWAAHAKSMQAQADAAGEGNQ